MDLAELNVFLTVAREKSFSRAAQKLFRTQPAVSIAIRKLEESVGEPLFARGARAGQLTDAGHLLAGYAERMLNLREEITRAVDDLRSGGRGQMSLGVNESSIHALLPVLSRYRRMYPDVHLAVRRTSSREIPAELLNHHLDLGVVSFVPQEPQLVAIKIFRDALTFVVSPRHKLAKKRVVDISDLGEEVFVAHIVESPFRNNVIQLFARHHVPLEMRVELPTIDPTPWGPNASLTVVGTRVPRLDALEKVTGRVEALYVCADPLVHTNAVRLNGLALAARLPA